MSCMTLCCQQGLVFPADNRRIVIRNHICKDTAHQTSTSNDTLDAVRGHVNASTCAPTVHLRWLTNGRQYNLPGSSSLRQQAPCLGPAKQKEVKEEILIFYQDECKGTLASSWINEILKSILKSSHLN